jgi:dTDP-4-dehydrorhamnose 3,5-epimerase
MDFEPLGLPGAWLVQARVLHDARGSFVKAFHAPTFAARGLRTDWREDYVSSSHLGVLRGMHFQTPPADHAKLVFCTAGAVLDLVLDLRRGSPTYGEHRAVTLSAENGFGLYIPSGLAHGFLSVSALSTMHYKVTSVHAPEHDAGIAWNSFGFPWPTNDPRLSDRDRQHPPLEDFQSPFVFDPDRPSA